MNEKAPPGLAWAGDTVAVAVAAADAEEAPGTTRATAATSAAAATHRTTRLLTIISLGVIHVTLATGGYVPTQARGRTVRALAGPGLALAMLVTGCGSSDGPLVRAPDSQQSPGATPTAQRQLSPLDNGKAGQLQPYGDALWPAYAVRPRAATLAVYDTPAGRVIRTFGDHVPSGAPQTFLLVGRRANWLQVELPVRPNGSSGWVKTSDTRMAGLRYALEVSRREHRIRVYDQRRLIHTFPVGIGTTETPTPGGLYYLVELLRPPNPNGAYGPYAYGLSGFSDVIHHFNGGNGVIGLHGTNEPGKVGTDVSHGCIRLRNRDITTLARLLPLGTPIRIVA